MNPLCPDIFQIHPKTDQLSPPVCLSLGLRDDGTRRSMTTGGAACAAACCADGACINNSFSSFEVFGCRRFRLPMGGDKPDDCRWTSRLRAGAVGASRALPHMELQGNARRERRRLGCRLIWLHEDREVSRLPPVTAHIVGQSCFQSQNPLMSYILFEIFLGGF